MFRLFVFAILMFGLTACTNFKLGAEKLDVDVSELSPAERDAVLEAEREYLGIEPNVMAKRNDVHLAENKYV